MKAETTYSPIETNRYYPPAEAINPLRITMASRLIEAERWKRSLAMVHYRNDETEDVTTPGRGVERTQQMLDGVVHASGRLSLGAGNVVIELAGGHPVEPELPDISQAAVAVQSLDPEVVQMAAHLAARNQAQRTAQLIRTDLGLEAAA